MSEQPKPEDNQRHFAENEQRYFKRREHYRNNEMGSNIDDRFGKMK